MEGGSRRGPVYLQAMVAENGGLKEKAFDQAIFWIFWAFTYGFGNAQLGHPDSPSAFYPH